MGLEDEITEVDSGELYSDVTDADEEPGDPLVDESAPEPKVLFVDDEHHILKAVRRLFVDRDFELLTAESGEEALEIVKANPIAVLVSDQRMPGISGTELLDFVRKNNPNTIRIMLTGNNDISTALEAINRGAVFRFVTKPWSHDDFLHTIDLALEQYHLRESKDRNERRIAAQNKELQQLNDKLRDFNEQLEDRVQERTKEVVAKKKEVARLYGELQQSFDGVIKALLCIMELGEIHVVEHCQRTAERVRRFGEHLGIDAELNRELERAALLHWIGLINASAPLFRKPIEEFDAVETATWEFHPLLGQQALRHVPALHDVGRFILYYLHRYDDRDFQPGAPFSGASAEEMDEEFIRGCQILGICSAFEQVKTSRQGATTGDSESRSWVQEGLRVISEGSGGRFDPDLVRRFKDWVGRKLESTRGRQVVISFDELESGMVLARPLETEQGIPVAPRDMIITEELIERLERFRDSNGLKEIHVWE